MTRTRFHPAVNIPLAAATVLILILVGSVQGSAQRETVPIEHLEVALWPEFDRSAMLVIYRFEVSPDTPLPARVALPVPAASGQPHAVAWLSADGGLFDAAFTSESAGDWQIVQVELPESRSGQLEFYADIDFAGSMRGYLFEWPNGFELGGMSYEVQQPVGATDLVVVPAPDTEGLGEYGLTNLAAELGAQLADSAPVISVIYQKSGPGLTVDSLQPLGQISAPVDVQRDSSSILPWIVGAAGLMLVSGGAIYFFAFRKRPAPQPASRRRRGQTSEAELVPSTVFCHNCGAVAGITDVYCRQCGTQLRR